LHQDREQHDWNSYFQPPSHDFPQNALGVLPPASMLVENTCALAVDAFSRVAFPHCRSVRE
jgi:hypothetical protein